MDEPMERSRQREVADLLAIPRRDSVRFKPKTGFTSRLDGTCILTSELRSSTDPAGFMLTSRRLARDFMAL
jgi:hypothetical protein